MSDMERMQHSSDGGYCHAALTTLLRWNASLREDVLALFAEWRQIQH